MKGQLSMPAGHTGSEPARNQRGYYDVGARMKGARTDDELVSAVVHRDNDTVRHNCAWQRLPGRPWRRSTAARRPVPRTMNFDLASRPHTCQSAVFMPLGA